ncbi:hypothetical protein, partial [Pseudomonas faucium]|uniref:hypothetical protein n=1 Tax=Pseudomonas faucium TaxID=2740518 RepID=UPI001CA5A7BD
VKKVVYKLHPAGTISAGVGLLTDLSALRILTASRAFYGVFYREPQLCQRSSSRGAHAMLSPFNSARLIQWNTKA